MGLSAADQQLAAKHPGHEYHRRKISQNSGRAVLSASVAGRENVYDAAPARRPRWAPSRAHRDDGIDLWRQSAGDPLVGNRAGQWNAPGILGVESAGVVEKNQDCR